MVQYIVKRNGEKVSFDAKKIRNAIFKANIRIAAERMSDADLDSLTAQVIAEFDGGRDVPTVEQIQDVVEEKLIAADYAKTAKAYILYRAEHQRLREMDDELVKIYRGSHLQAGRGRRPQARKREHRRRHRDGHDAEVRLRGREAVL